MGWPLRAPRVGGEAEGPHPPLAEACIRHGLEGLCYPPGLPGCDRVQASLEAAGVSAVCGLAGKGHASVVAVAVTGYGVKAVKVRRLDSRRDSLAGEGSALAEASRSGATPRVYYYDDNVIVMDYVEGPTLGELAERRALGPGEVAEALDAARALDAAGILHLELHRPWGNVIYTFTGRAYIVDLDSHSRGCGNVARLVSGLARLSPRLLREVSRGPLRALLRSYTREGCPGSLYAEIKKAVLGVVGAHSLVG